MIKTSYQLGKSSTHCRLLAVSQQSFEKATGFFATLLVELQFQFVKKMTKHIRWTKI
jgi:hypothetical protein